MGYIIVYGANEVVKLFSFEVLVNRNNISWNEVFRRLTVSPADHLVNLFVAARFIKRSEHVQLKRLTSGCDFFTTIKNADAFCGFWQLGHKVLD